MGEIVIADYDPAWAGQFAEIAGRVRAAFAGGQLMAVEHIGSTAVVGLAAKPIIDVDVVVPSHADVSDALARLAALGYIHQGDLGISGREAFHTPTGDGSASPVPVRLRQRGILPPSDVPRLPAGPLGRSEAV